MCCRLCPAGPLRIEAEFIKLFAESRHPAPERDVQGWRGLHSVVERGVVVATTINTLSRGQRIRASRTLGSVFQDPVPPGSAATGEGLDELWKVIDNLAQPRDPSLRSRNRPAETAKPLPKK